MSSLDTAHRRADSSHRRRPCEAKRNKAIGDHRGDKRAISAALRARTSELHRAGLSETAFDNPRHRVSAVGHLKLEIDDRERRAIERSLAERRSHLIEKAEDTTLTPARRQASYRELSAIASAGRTAAHETIDGGIRL